MLQLGEQLIKNESIALLELVKNAYDADARTVQITMSDIENPDVGQITVEDDGSGMSPDIVRNVWMEPGSDFKERLFSKRTRSSKYKRLPLGEKGIGRFGAHKLGDTIELVTRMKGKPEVFFRIDWTAFRDSIYLEDVPIEVTVRKPKVFKGARSGTQITIAGLRQPWTRGAVRDVYRSVNSLCSPFTRPTSFRVAVHLCDNQEWLKGLLTWKDVKEHALYRVRCTIRGEEIVRFRYQFTPWELMSKLEPRVVDETDERFDKIKRMVRGRGKAIEPLDLSQRGIGEVRFEALIFDRTAKILALGMQDRKGFKEYLDQNGGIRVYRDGIRVYDYGEPGSDWLELGTRRVNVPTRRISNNIILGAVHLKRSQSDGLIEKTNREGFIENEAYLCFKDAILYAIDKIENFRNPDKERVQTLYGSTPKSEPVMSSLAELKAVVNSKVRDAETRQELVRYIDRIEKDYQYMNETLLKGAGAGLTLGIVIHEMQKVAKELLLRLEKGQASEGCLALAQHLSSLVEGYVLVLRGVGKKEEDLLEIIDQALFNIEFRLRDHGISVVRGDTSSAVHSRVKCAKRFVLNSILNVVDNSIWWLDYYRVQDRQVYVALSNEMPGYTSILLADNGRGFSLPTEEIVKPFVSGKPDDAGMGIGLHIVDETMRSQNGLLLFPEVGDFDIPQEFTGGAVMALCFRQ
jgi:signal transduction histidine kinase